MILNIYLNVIKELVVNTSSAPRTKALVTFTHFYVLHPLSEPQEPLSGGGAGGVGGWGGGVGWGGAGAGAPTIRFGMHTPFL